MTEKNNKKKNYALRIFLFLLLVAAADFTIGNLLGYFYKRQSSGMEHGTRFSVEETTADVLIFGSSRAQQQYNPKIIEDSLGLTCYNTGRDGMSLLYHYAVLQGVLKRYHPKMIVLDCEFGMLKKSESSYDRLSSLLPFYKGHPEMREVIALKSPFEKFKLLSYTYPYNSMVFKIAVANLQRNKSRITEINGYLPLTRSLDHPKRPVFFEEKYETDSIKVQLLESFATDCKNRGIQLFFVCPPYYMDIHGTDYSFTLSKQIAAKNNIDFIDWSVKEPFYSNPALFDDTVHVNKQGAELFSAMIARELHKKLQTK